MIFFVLFSYVMLSCSKKYRWNWAQLGHYLCFKGIVWSFACLFKFLIMMFFLLYAYKFAEEFWICDSWFWLKPKFGFTLRALTISRTVRNIICMHYKGFKYNAIRQSVSIWNDFHTFVFLLFGILYTVICSLQDKKSLKLVPDDSLYLEGFASNVFAKADKQDRAGRADL